MASVALGRVSGTVLAISERGGTFRAGHPRAGESWLIESANVLVADQNVTVCQLPRRDEFGRYDALPGGRPEKGDVIDFLVEHSIYGQEVQTRILAEWPSDDSSSYLAA